MKASIMKHLKQLERVSIANSPTILTAIGVVGVATTAYLAVRGARAHFRHEIIEGVVEEIPQSPKDRLKSSYKFYIPAAISGSLTCAAIISANRIGTKRTAALAAAYTISEQAFSEYRTKIVEKIGDRKETQYRDEIAQERITRTAEKYMPTVVGTGKVPCYDMFTDRYFQSTIEDIKKAQNDTNYRMLNDGYASLSDFYESIGLPATSMSEELGWSRDRQLDVKFGTHLSPDGTPCLAIDFLSAPQANFWKFH